MVRWWEASGFLFSWSVPDSLVFRWKYMLASFDEPMPFTNKLLLRCPAFLLFLAAVFCLLAIAACKYRSMYFVWNIAVAIRVVGFV